MTNPDDLLDLVQLAAAVADDKKANDPVIIDVGDVFSVSDYFVVVSGSNPRQVAAIVDAVVRGWAAREDRGARGDARTRVASLARADAETSIYTPD